MAFQTGTQVRPELGRADVSGFARGGAAISSGILQGIQNYQQQKQITASALSDLEGRMAADPSVLPAMQQAGEGNPKLAKALKNLTEGNYNQADVLALDGFASAFEKQKIASQQSQLRKAQIAQIGRGPTETETAKAAAELAETKAKTAKIEAETAAIGKPKSLTAAERMRLIETKVGDITFGQYLQELKKTKAIKGGELHQRGLLNFDEDQIAAFDDVLINYPEFLKDMPQAVQDYYTKASGSPRLINLPDGTQVEVTPQ